MSEKIEWKSIWEIQWVGFLTTTSDFNPETHFSTSDKGEASNVTIDGTMIRALPGGNGGDGGNGHSGGGGGPDDMCYGGSNGSDGECSNGVKGLGKILPLLILKILTLVLEMEANILYILQVKNLYGGAKISLQFYHFFVVIAWSNEIRRSQFFLEKT